MLNLKEFNSWRKQQKGWYASKASKNKENRIFLNVYFATGQVEIEVKNKNHELVDKYIYSEQNTKQAIDVFNDL